MKFGKTWKEYRSLLPTWYQKNSFPYKTWKKLIKTKKYNIEQLENKIKMDIQKINYVINCILNTGKIFKILHKDLFINNIHHVNIIKFIKLNTISLHKISKKINKHYNSEAINLLENIQKYNFMNPIFLNQLEIKFKIYNYQCYYCDDISKRKTQNNNRYIHCPLCLEKIIPGSKYALFERIGVY
jgi:predicted SprT family Zn-dependent metalloprotease